jgi:hypothetical protein
MRPFRGTFLSALSRSHSGAKRRFNACSAGHSSVCDTSTIAWKSRDSCQLESGKSEIDQLYRIFFRLFLIHVLSTNKTCLAYAMVDVPSAFDLAPYHFRHGAYHVGSSKSKGALI